MKTGMLPHPWTPLNSYSDASHALKAETLTTSSLGGRDSKISLVPEISSKEFLERATATYLQEWTENPDIGSAVEYLKSRGLSWGNAQYFRLGNVANPLPGHEKYQGRLAIPYITRSGVTTIRFRSLNPDEQGAKYLSLPGDEPRIFNTIDLDRRESYVCICEGEFDAMTAHSAGLPAVGIAGVKGWRPFFKHCFKGYEAVYILSDNDDKGQGLEFAEKVAAEISGARIVLMPKGEDVNSFVVKEGPEALKDRLKIK